MPNEFKPYVPLPQHKGIDVDDVKRMEHAQKHARGEELTDELMENGRAILDQKKHIRDAKLERKDTPEEETETDA